MIELEKFRTVHRVNADSEVTIQWSAPDAKGEYKTWVTKDFKLESHKNQQKIIDNWILNHPNKPKSFIWAITNLIN